MWRALRAEAASKVDCLSAVRGVSPTCASGARQARLGAAAHAEHKRIAQVHRCTQESVPVLVLLADVSGFDPVSCN